MIGDKLLTFSTAQAITATADATNVVPLGAARDIGVGEPVYIVSTLTTGLTDSSGTDATLTVNLVTDDNAALSSDSAVQELFTFAHGDAAGTQKFARINPGDYEEYLGINYVVASGPFSAGAITTEIVKDIQKYTPVASGYTVS